MKWKWYHPLHSPAWTNRPVLDYKWDVESVLFEMFPDTKDRKKRKKRIIVSVHMSAQLHIFDSVFHVCFFPFCIFSFCFKIISDTVVCCTLWFSIFGTRIEKNTSCALQSPCRSLALTNTESHFSSWSSSRYTVRFCLYTYCLIHCSQAKKVRQQ